MITGEEATTLSAIIGLAGMVLGILWRVFKVSRVFLKDHEEIKQSITTIKSEVTPNGGGSLKDVCNSLKKSCDRIESRQKVLDQRSKAALHYTDRPLFETDKLGRIMWSNEAFQNVTRENGDFSEGFDWIAVIEENHRDDFLREFNSCLKMCRKVDIETVSVNGGDIHFVGYPYRVNKESHEGFLIHLNKEN
tara:strand:- start:405 stop:980 length:576 start_codon:yes stop_codon:yes gene_type:complete